MSREANLQRELPLPQLNAATPLPADLPVAGGWGYSREAPCIITDKREPDPETDEVQGRDHALSFIPERLLLELNAMRIEAPLAHVKWRVVTEELERDEGGKPMIDHFHVNVTAWLREGLEELEKLEALMPKMDGDNVEQWKELRARRSRLRFSNECHFWFDISGVRGIADDADQYMLISGGEFATPDDE